ncbi:AMP-binding protein [Nocardia sp. bgisy118]|uniref:class I adenylate-forming enzyme family protein n=1 Tax=Nocardia sp. bgisy118 TaxID=3413786 RepID=UPI003F4A7F79
MIHRRSHRLDELVLGGLAARGKDLALIGSGTALSGRETADEVARLTAMLRTAGLTPGEAVLVAVDNHPSDLVCQLAIWQADCVVVPVYRRHPVAVVSDIMQRCAARYLVGPVPSAWTGLVTASRDVVHTLQSSDAGPASRPQELDRDQALIVFTSGSTGKPKGVVISHRAFATKLCAIDSVLYFAEAATMLQVLHLHFSFGQWTSLLTLGSGGQLELVRRYETDLVLRRLADAYYDRIAVVPTMMRMIASRLTDPGCERLLAAMRASGSPGLWIAGGEPLAAGLGQQFRSLLPRSGLADVFGLSESATSDFIVPPDEYDALAGTIGHPSPGVEARVVPMDGQTAEAPFDVVGELWLRTPHLMTGYLGDQAATIEAIVGNWLKTGDLARRRRDGMFELAGRAKNLIVRGGMKISPLEVENVFSAHPDCSGVIATGVADTILGERIHLVVTPHPGRIVDPNQIRDWGRARIESYKLPDVVHVIDVLPTGVTGKTDRLAVSELVRERLSVNR